MSLLLNGDCLEEMKQIEDCSIDLVFCDLPYATEKYSQISCKWNTPIDLDKFWIEIMRIKKLNTPIFMTCTTKFGVDLINSCPKKCPFRYDIVWCKSAPAGFLSAKKMPMRKHEMVYVFYEKLPFYDLSSHKHKFIDQSKNKNKLNSGIIYNGGKEMKVISDGKGKQYSPPLPVSVVKEPEPESNGDVNEKYDGNYGEIKQPEYITNNITRNKLRRKYKKEGKSESAYEPPLPTSVVKEDKHTLYGEIKEKGIPHTTTYSPPLPTSIVKEEVVKEPEPESKYVGKPVLRENTTYGDVISYEIKERKNGESRYEPALPTSMLEIKSTRGKHSTEKPVALMEWILKYYSKEGDVVLDATMGSGSMGVACKNMNRNFIGIEKDTDIYDSAVKRIEG